MFHLDGLVLFGKRDGGKDPVAVGEDGAVGVSGVGIADDFGIAVAIDIGDIEDVEGNAEERPELVGEVFHIGMDEVAGGGTVGGGAVVGVEGIGRKAVGQKKRMEHDAVGVEVGIAHAHDFNYLAIIINELEGDVVIGVGTAVELQRGNAGKRKRFNQLKGIASLLVLKLTVVAAGRKQQEDRSQDDCMFHCDEN